MNCLRFFQCFNITDFVFITDFANLIELNYLKSKCFIFHILSFFHPASAKFFYGFANRETNILIHVILSAYLIY